MMILAILTTLVSYLVLLLPSVFAGPHDTYTRFTCYCVPDPAFPNTKYLNNVRSHRYYNAGINQLFINNHTCVDDTLPVSRCLPHQGRGEGACATYAALTDNDDHTKLNRFCHHSRTEWEEVLDRNFDAGFNFNGHDRSLGKDGSRANTDFNLDVVQKACEPVCKEHFGGVPMGPLQLGQGRVVQSYKHEFIDFGDIETCDGCGTT
ncbi:MAG: hypothetical protein Q9219_004750 [cf. Caloplaca sp. 3 TL-2023]